MAIFTLENPGDGVRQERVPGWPTVWVINCDFNDNIPSPLSVHLTKEGAIAAWLKLYRESLDEEDEYDEKAALALLEGDAEIGDSYFHIYERLLEVSS